MRIPLQRGRPFVSLEDAQAPPVALVNEEWVRRFLPDADPLGQRITIGANLGSMGTLPEVPRQIVGVVGDVRHAGLGAGVEAEIYFPMAQGVWRFVGLIVRIDDGTRPSLLLKPIMEEIWAVDANLPVSDAGLMQDNAARSIAQPKLYMGLLTAFATMAWILALVGVYGVVSQAVGQRTYEMGLRIALGASRGQILVRIVGEGVLLAAGGIVLGLLAAWALSRSFEELLFATSSRNPGAFLGVAALMAVAALAASLVPALRATRVNPHLILRNG